MKNKKATKLAAKINSLIGVLAFWIGYLLGVMTK